MKKILTFCFILLAFNANAMEKETTFKKELFDKAQSEGKVVVVSSWIKYCTSCASQMKVLNKAKNDFKNIEYFTFDVTNKDIANFFNVQYQTTLLIFKDSKEVYRSVGETTKELIYKALKLDQCSIDINNIYEKCEAIFDFINTIKGEVFLKSFKRVLNILESENKLLLKTEVTDVNPELLQSRYEKDLFDTFKRLKLKNLDFNELLKSLVTLSKPINIFFEKVQINDKNILLKINRLYLLFIIKNYVVSEIDFSKIIKGKEL